MAHSKFSARNAWNPNFRQLPPTAIIQYAWRAVGGNGKRSEEKHMTKGHLLLGTLLLTLMAYSASRAHDARQPPLYCGAPVATEDGWSIATPEDVGFDPLRFVSGRSAGSPHRATI